MNTDNFLSSIIHKYCFGNSENLLQDMQLANSRRQNVVQVLARTHFNLHFSWARNLMQKLPPSIGAKLMPPGVKDIIAFRRAMSKQIGNILSSKSSSDDTPSIFTYLRDSPELPDSEKSPARLLDEAVLLIMSGTYSPMLSLIVAQYHLITRPGIMAKLRSELRAHPESASPEQLQQLPYLSASLFPDPWRFDPERWIITDETQQEIVRRRRRAMMSFMAGTSRGCPGMHLADAEMAVVVAAMARWEMRLYQTTAEDVEFLHDYHVMSPKLDSKGVRVEIVGRAEGM
ncbi:hypothetical protein KVR01_007133 [Diaporthe batatas]|uniref:uncharacterized protein n=1 Tax=Diaporthe batatas TaxID=748121 RepID=UPI001D048E3D|nr:uncharacterized protein KVR01_007133 [Diaporthe batatas]KAG8162655.1 hypothetical protein KVR01_007133 [Diaporthe batatas]